MLLTHQDAPEPEVQLPGGGIDPGESPVQALIREVYEETGWRISRPRRLGAYRRFTYMPEYDLWGEDLPDLHGLSGYSLWRPFGAGAHRFVDGCR